MFFKQLRQTEIGNGIICSGRIRSDLWKDLRLSASGGKDCSLVWVRVGILCEMGGL